MSDDEDVEKNLRDSERSEYYEDYLQGCLQSDIPRATWYRYQKLYGEKEGHETAQNTEPSNPESTSMGKVDSLSIMNDESTSSSILDTGDNNLFAKNKMLSSQHEIPPTRYKMPFASCEIFSQKSDSKENESMEFLEEEAVPTYVESVLSIDTKITDQVLRDVKRVMGELADDINDDSPTVQYVECDEEDDYFADARDKNYFDINLGDESTLDKEYIAPETKYTTLEDIMAGADFSKPATVPVTKTIGEIIIMIVRYAFVNALSLVATVQLFSLINCIFDTPILPKTKYLIDKLFYTKKWANFHAICTQCNRYAGTFDPRKDRHFTCKLCNVEISVKEYDYEHFFITMDPSIPISELLEANSNYYNFVVDERSHKKGFMTDIYDGTLYRDFVKSLNEGNKHQYATTTFNTDGAPLFESSTTSIWPIYLMVNELPYSVRTKNLILAGLWFGKNKPDMDVFLHPFVENMNQLSKVGVVCNFNGIRRQIKIFPLVCCVDSVARAPVQGFVQYNARDGCGQCLHPGEYVRNSEKPHSGGCIKYPLLNTIPEDRNMADTIRHAEQATSKKPVSGVKSRSRLIDLIKFDLIRGCVPDSMHACSGVAKQISKSLFGTKKKVGLMSRQLIGEIDKVLASIKCPHQVVRLTRPFSEREFWKAREWENWTIYYSLPILLYILSVEYLMHWALFVEAFYILSQSEIQSVELDRADKLLHQFVVGTEKLYTKVAMTFNIHLLLHLSKSVHSWGPLWAINAFPFEAGNGQLLKGIHSPKGIHHQVCRRISLQFSMVKLEKKVNPTSSVRQFCTSIGNKMVQKTLQLSAPRYFGYPIMVHVLWINNLNLSPECTVSYAKMVKNGCLFMSSAESNNRSDNTYAMLNDNMYIKMNYFIVDRKNKMEWTIVKKIRVINTLGNVYEKFKKIVEISDEESAVLTSSISKICVHITINQHQYICSKLVFILET